MTKPILPTGLYLVTDEGDNLRQRIEAAIAGGARTVQYRRKTAGPERRRDEALELCRLCRARGVLFIINDDALLAKEVGADGVHLGQDDGCVAEARRLLGERLVGVSTHDLHEALRAQEEGADYIGFGAMFPTASKEVVHLPGPERLAEIRSRLTIPIVAIGGITRGNGGAVIDAGADAVAVISTVLSSADPETAAAEMALLFNRRLSPPSGTVLAVGGSDSGGGAGIQADLKTTTLLGCYGASVVTAVTAQNSRGVAGVHSVPAAAVALQLEAVLADMKVDVVKTGMLCSADIVGEVAAKLAEFRRRIVIVDPVIASSSGTRLLDDGGVRRLLEEVVPITYLFTPNVPEAEILTGLRIDTLTAMEDAAVRLHAAGAKHVVVKGGHLPGEPVDLHFDGTGFRCHRGARTGADRHGTGCSFASAVAAFVARGVAVEEAVAQAKTFVAEGIRLAPPIGGGRRPLNHHAAAAPFLNMTLAGESS